MGKDTSIQWTDHSWPVTTGCDDESPGCLNCYSKSASYRMGLNPNPKISAAYGGTVEKRGDILRWTGVLKTLPDRLDWPFKWKKPARIFVGNMSDLFHEDVPDSFIDDVFRVMHKAGHHTFQVLTKRAERMAEYCVKRWDNSHPLSVWHLPSNIWLGVSVEDQKRADERIPHLLRTSAAVRFLSVEPMLSSIDLSEWLFCDRCRDDDRCGRGAYLTPLENACGSPWFRECRCSELSWVIVGGESGARARPFDLKWARSLLDQCKLAGVPFFMKQYGSNPYDSEKLIDARIVNGKPIIVRGNTIKLTGKHGGDMEEWEEGLRVREFPCIERMATHA